MDYRGVKEGWWRPAQGRGRLLSEDTDRRLAGLETC